MKLATSKEEHSFNSVTNQSPSFFNQRANQLSKEIDQLATGIAEEGVQSFTNALKIVREVQAVLCNTTKESQFAYSINSYFNNSLIPTLELYVADKPWSFSAGEVYRLIFAVHRLVLADSETFAEPRFMEALVKLIAVVKWFAATVPMSPTVQNNFEFWKCIRDPQVAVFEANKIYNPPLSSDALEELVAESLSSRVK